MLSTLIATALGSLQLFATVSTTGAENVPITLLDAELHPKAKCLDGSPAGYYLQESTVSSLGNDTTARNKWVIYLGGGGECDTEEYCLEQTQNKHGSSKYFKSSLDPTEWYVASDNCDNNPDFCSWNHLHNPYCSQDMHSGQITVPSDETWGLYFAGHWINEALLDEMDKGSVANTSANRLTDATDIVILGASAGGIGTWMHIDYIAQRYPNARVSGITVAGHYFYANYYTGPDATNPADELTDMTEEGWEKAYSLYDAFVDESCKATYDTAGLSPFPCMLSTKSFPYVDSEMYIVQSQTDQVVLTYHDRWPEEHMAEEEEVAYTKEWHQNMTAAVDALTVASTTGQGEEQTDRRFGHFTAACYTHTTFQSFRPSISGTGYMEAFGNFYFNRSEAEGYNFADDCGEMCNPSCV